MRASLQPHYVFAHMVGVHKEADAQSSTEYRNGEYVVSLWFASEEPAKKMQDYFRGVFARDWNNLEYHNYGSAFLVRIRFKRESEG